MKFDMPFIENLTKGKRKMRNITSLLFAISFVLLLGIFKVTPFSTTQFGTQIERDSLYPTEINMERAASPWAGFVFDGPCAEAPEEIETLQLTGKWIQSFDMPQQGYFLAYTAEVSLKRHNEEKIHTEGTHEWAVADYSVSFDFYLLDESGFCLKEIKTSDKNCQTFPSFGGHFIQPGEGIDAQQTVVIGLLSEELVSRIKKVIYLPKFKTCCLKAL